MRALVVDDDTKLAKLLRLALQRENYSVDVAHEGQIGIEKATANKYDVLILDLSLPDTDGLDVCKSLRKSGVSTPILMLTGRGSELDRVTGLDSGADDYLAKPFSVDELMARLRAILRRPKVPLPTKLEVADLRLDPVSHVVKRNNKTIELMPKEYALLEYLMRRKGEVCKRHEILNHVWGVYSQTSSNRLEVYVRYLREKVDEPFVKPLIKTVRGSGYKISDE